MLKIAGIQLHCAQDKTQNLAQTLTLVQHAIEKGAKIVCLQQLFNLPWFPSHAKQEHFALAEDLSQDTIPVLSQLAAQKQVVLICPIFERTAEGQYYNSALVINQDGNILGQYRKMHVPDLPLWRERFYFAPGDLGFPVFKTDHATIGVQLCWDVFFPEGFRILAMQGAQLIFCPTAAAYAATQQRWKKVIYGHAIANNLYIMRVNRVGKEGNQTFYGNSFCVDPHGNLLAETGDTDQSILMCEIELEEISRLRQHWNFLGDRRPEAYTSIGRSR